MSIMRSDDQVALQDLHSRIMESVDHYRDSARFIDDERAATLFRQIADDREQLATAREACRRDAYRQLCCELDQAIRESRSRLESALAD